MLVIRVKRNREDDSAETLCLVEDGNSLPSKKKKTSINNLANQFANSFGGVASTSSAGEPTLPNTTEQNPPINGKSAESKKRLILHRVSTISSYDKTTLDNETIAALYDKTKATQEATEASSSQTQENGPVTKKAKVILTQSKKALPIKGQESCIIVDMMQVYNGNNHTADTTTQSSGATTSAVSIPSANTTPNKGKKILDPPTRLLGKGILTAIQRGDFNDISSALIQGANPNHQLDITEGGYTALMAAAMKTNIRMVKRLLLSEVNVLLKSKDHYYAIDYLKESAYNKQDCQEIRSLLQSTMLKAMQSQAQEQQPSASLLSSADHQQQYVIDIYCVQTPEDMVSEVATEAAMDDTPVPATASLISIEGLKIMEDGYNVELLEYDSDWSDLADDEDPDSNDERHYGNDYPDEESEEDPVGGLWANRRADAEEEADEEAGLFGYSATSHLHKKKSKHRSNKGHNGDDNDDEDEDEEEDDDEEDDGDNEDDSDYDLLEEPVDRTYRGRKIQFSLPTPGQVRFAEPHPTARSAYNAQLEEQEELQTLEAQFEDGQRHQPIFDRQQSIGRVLHTHTIADGSSDALASAGTTMSSEQLRELWQEGGEDEQGLLGTNGNNAGIDHQQRVQDMRQRTGMLFAANPREFTANGLPKYGMELSDDEVDLELLQSSGIVSSGNSNTNTINRDNKQLIAYDSELDKSSSDDDNDMMQ